MIPSLTNNCFASVNAQSCFVASCTHTHTHTRTHTLVCDTVFHITFALAYMYQAMLALLRHWTWSCSRQQSSKAAHAHPWTRARCVRKLHVNVFTCLRVCVCVCVCVCVKLSVYVCMCDEIHDRCLCAVIDFAEPKKPPCAHPLWRAQCCLTTHPALTSLALYMNVLHVYCCHSTMFFVLIAASRILRPFLVSSLLRNFSRWCQTSAMGSVIQAHLWSNAARQRVCLQHLSALLVSEICAGPTLQASVKDGCCRGRRG